MKNFLEKLNLYEEKDQTNSQLVDLGLEFEMFLCPNPDHAEGNEQYQNDCEYDQELEEKLSQAVLHIRSEIDRMHHCLLK